MLFVLYLIFKDIYQSIFVFNSLTQLYAGRVISLSFCTMFFVPTSLCRKQTLQSPSYTHRGDQLSIWTTIDDRL